jgi:uncharacterized delta-60 repeat protein
MESQMLNRASNNFLPLFESLENRQLLSAGELDTTFGSGGKVLTNQGLAAGTGVALQADGKIVVAAQGDGMAATGFELIRYNSDGSIDSSFGDSGIASSLPDDTLQAMVVQPDGKILLAGLTTYEGSGSYTISTVLTRYNDDGTLDTSFGTDGVVSLPGDTYDGTNSGTLSPGNVKLAVQTDGKILVTQVLGDDGTVSGADLNVIRLTDAGAVDHSFHATIELGVAEIPKDMAIQADGKIVLAIDGETVSHAGGGFSSSTLASYVVRLNADGSIDTDFGSDGIVTENASNWQINVGKIAIGLDGKVLLMGEEMGHDRSVTSFLIRYNTDGTRDTDFGDGGMQVLDAGDGGSFGDLLVQPDGKILLSGETSTRAGKPSMLSERLNADGSLDTDYGTSGWTVVSVGSQFDSAGAMALQQDGSILVLGSSEKSHDEHSSDMSDLAIIRLEGDAGSAGSAHASLRRGKDQQAPYLGQNKVKHRSPKRIAMELAAQAAATASHRSPKRIAMELAAEAAAGHRSPKRIAMDLAALNSGKIP